MSAEHRSKLAALHWQWWRLHMSEKFSSGTINSTIIKKKNCTQWCTEEARSTQPETSVMILSSLFWNWWILFCYFSEICLSIAMGWHLSLCVVYCEYALFSFLPICSTLITLVLRDCNAAFLCRSQFLFTLWWSCWYANMSLVDKKSVPSLCNSGDH